MKKKNKCRVRLIYKRVSQRDQLLNDVEIKQNREINNLDFLYIYETFDTSFPRLENLE